MVPVKKCVICGKHPRYDRCPECANFEHNQESRFNEFCEACCLSNYCFFEKIRTYQEGRKLKKKYWDIEIEIDNILYTAPTPEQLSAFFKIYPDWKGEPLNQYRKLKFNEFCKGWRYAQSSLLNPKAPSGQLILDKEGPN